MAFKQSMSSSLTAHFPFSISTQTKETLSTFNRHIRLSETAVIFTGTVEKQKNTHSEDSLGALLALAELRKLLSQAEGRTRTPEGFVPDLLWSLVRAG